MTAYGRYGKFLRFLLTSDRSPLLDSLRKAKADIDAWVGRLTWPYAACQVDLVAWTKEAEALSGILSGIVVSDARISFDRWIEHSLEHDVGALYRWIRCEPATNLDIVDEDDGYSRNIDLALARHTAQWADIWRSNDKARSDELATTSENPDCD